MAVDNFSGTGNELNNVIRGASDNNVLKGMAGNDTLKGMGGNDALLGGEGNDTLTGGTGADSFKFKTTTEGTDSITDFATGEDRIQVVSTNFGKLPVGTLAADRFVAAGTPLTSGDAVFLYHAGTGSLAFDSNGSGAGGVSTIATLTGSKALVASDIAVVAA